MKLKLTHQTTQVNYIVVYKIQNLIISYTHKKEME